MNKSEQQFIRKFEHLLKTNNLYIREGSYITESVKVEFRLTDAELVVRLIPHGNRFTDKVSEMEAELQSVLNLELIDKKQTLVSTDYFLRLRRARRINYENYYFNLAPSGNSIAINSEIYWNLTKSPHALISGSTGGGKTYFLFHILYSLKQIDADIYIADPKRSDLYNLRKTKAVKPEQVECETNRICGLLRTVKEKMDERYQEIAFNNRIGANYEEV